MRNFWKKEFFLKITLYLVCIFIGGYTLNFQHDIGDL